MPNLSTKVDQDFLKKARAAARRNGTTVSSFVREAVAERLRDGTPKTFGEIYPDGIGFDSNAPANLSTREGFPGKKGHR